MYEKKISYLSDDDRTLFSTTFKYNVIFGILFVMIFFTLLLIKKDHYYENVISFVDKKNATIIASQEILLEIKKNNTIFLNSVAYQYSIDKISEEENIYLVDIHFDIEIDIDVLQYQIKLEQENLANYIIRIIKGG